MSIFISFASLIYPANPPVITLLLPTTWFICIERFVISGVRLPLGSKDEKRPKDTLLSSLVIDIPVISKLFPYNRPANALFTEGRLVAFVSELKSMSFTSLYVPQIMLLL